MRKPLDYHPREVKPKYSISKTIRFDWDVWIEKAIKRIFKKKRR